MVSLAVLLGRKQLFPVLIIFDILLVIDTIYDCPVSADDDFLNFVVRSVCKTPQGSKVKHDQKVRDKLFVATVNSWLS